MKYPAAFLTIATTLGAALMSTPALSAPAAELQIKMDQGQVNVTVGDIDQDYVVKTSFPANCQASKINESYRGSVLTLSHAGTRCAHGGTADIVVNKKFTLVKVALESGIARLKPLAPAIDVAASITAVVDAGLIESKVLAVSRSSDYAGANGEYKSSDANKTTRFEFKVQSGLVEF